MGSRRTSAEAPPTRRRTWRVWAFLATVAAGCGGLEAPDDSTGHATAVEQAIVDVEQSPVKRQSIGNCWLYATASWVESLGLTATGRVENVSESYWTYWSWFEQIVTLRADTLSTGGTFSSAKRLIARYGLMREGDFIAEEATAELSQRQARALASVERALERGDLQTVSARGDRRAVRRALDTAFELSLATRAELDRVFGADVSFDLRDGRARSSRSVRSPDDVAVAFARTDGGAPRTSTLREALGEWREQPYPASPARRRSLLQRVQRALHARVPVLLSWFVDFAALDATGAFRAPPARPGTQGFHLTVAEDYEVWDVPGYGRLRAGELETRRAALEAAVDPSASVIFMRIKNSWGAARPDRAFVPGFPGYHDLYFDYLDGPIARCDEGEAGAPRRCDAEIIPLQAIFLPQGF